MSSANTQNDTTVSSLNLSGDVSSIAPYQLSKLVQQTLNLQKQVQMAQKSAHQKMTSLQKEIEELTQEKGKHEKKMKRLDTKIKNLRRRNRDQEGAIEKLKPYKFKYQELTVQNAELVQKVNKYKESLQSASGSRAEKKALDSPPRSKTVNGNDLSKYTLDRRSSTTSLRGDVDSSQQSSSRRFSTADSNNATSRRHSFDASRRHSVGSPSAPLNNFPPLSSILQNGFSDFNNALMDFLDATTHLSIYDSCNIVHDLITICQERVSSLLQESSDTILDTLYSAHNSSADSDNSELFKKEKLKNSKVFQNFLKQFRQIESSNLLDYTSITKKVTAELQKKHSGGDISDDTYGDCIQAILPIIVNLALKGLGFKSGQQEDLKGKMWDIAKYDLLDSGSDRSESITVVVRPSLIRTKNGKEVKKPLVCCCSAEEDAKSNAEA